MYTVKMEKGLENIQDAKEVRIRVFMEEQGFTNEFDDIDAWAYHVVIYDHGQPIATGRTFSEEDGVYHLGRIAVDQPYRGKQIGRMIIGNLEKKLMEIGAKKAVLSAQITAQGFYEKLGYHTVGAPYNDEHCPHIDMEKEF